MGEVPAQRGRRPAATALTVAVCAVVAAVARVPGTGWSLGPDESGFTLVARTWQAAPDSPYGRYWVDRPPALIALVRLADAIGGPHLLRWVAAAGAALVVLAAAALAREVARSARPATEDRAVVLTALGTTALVSNAWIDLVYAKGEVLALPLLVGSMWLVLRAVRTGGWLPAATAGLLGGAAIGLKQNLYGGLLFALVVLVGEAVRGRLSRSRLARLGGAFAAGALVTLVATTVWALAAGVHLSSLWYAVYGFRGDAFDVILAGPHGATLRRAARLVVLSLTTGLAVLFVWFLLSVPRLARRRRVLTLATLAVLVVDSVSLVLGGSYWRPYLFGLVPAAVLALALLGSTAPGPAPAPARPRRSASGLVTQGVVTLLVVSFVVAGALWVRAWPSHEHPTAGVLVGRAIAAGSGPGDTLTVWGGQADVQLAADLASPYPYLWSLPARTLDPGSRRLAALLAGPRAPTWFLAWVSLDAWRDGSGARLEAALRQRYVQVGARCAHHVLYRLRDAPRPDPAVSCAALARARSDPGS